MDIKNERIKLIKAKEVEERYGAPAEKSLINGKGGTERLTRVKLGRSVYFIEDEVQQFIGERISAARSHENQMRKRKRV